MSEVLALERIAMVESDYTLTMSVGSGQSLAVVGPSGSGKSHFLHLVGGSESAKKGTVTVQGAIAFASAEGVSRRTKVQAALPRGDAEPRAPRVADLLYKLGLAELRHKQVGELTSGQFAAYELLRGMAASADLLLIDGQLDLLDPWALNAAMGMLREMQGRGATVVAATNRPDLIAQFDAVIVLQNKVVKFAGLIEDLRRIGPKQSVEAATNRQAGVRALVEPFQVDVTQTPEGFRFEAAEGQELAARLLLEGYGDVKFVVWRTPTLEEALLSLTQP